MRNTSDQSQLRTQEFPHARASMDVSNADNFKFWVLVADVLDLKHASSRKYCCNTSGFPQLEISFRTDHKLPRYSGWSFERTVTCWCVTVNLMVWREDLSPCSVVGYWNAIGQISTYARCHDEILTTTLASTRLSQDYCFDVWYLMYCESDGVLSAQGINHWANQTIFSYVKPHGFVRCLSFTFKSDRALLSNCWLDCQCVQRMEM